MDAFVTGPQGDRRLSDESVSSSSSSSKGRATSTVTPVSQPFEWIQHGDAGARKRARAHVTRGFRRQNAAEAKEKKRKGSSDESGDGGGPPQDRIAKINTDTCIVETWARPDTSSEDERSPVLALGLALRTGVADPFGSMPIELGPGTHALLNHFLSGVAPTTFRADNKANFQPVKALSFEVALSAPPAFHVILSAAANDIAALHGREDSREAIMHRGKALALVSKGLAKTEQMPGDEVLAGVAIFTGNELLFGSPQDFNTHMEGLASMLRLRGGLDSFQHANPGLYSIINWFDYSGSCNLLATRRFAPVTQEFDIISSNPFGAPQAITRSLPIGYDLRKSIGDLFQGLKTVATLLCSSVADEQERNESAAFISRVDSDLYTSVCAPEQEGNRSRRRHVLQSYHILILISTALISKAPKGAGSAISSYLDVLEIMVTTESDRWGNAAIELLRSLFGDTATDIDFNIEVKKVIDASVTLCWEEWSNIKTALMAFFVGDEACEGRLQTLWKGRLAVISA